MQRGERRDPIMTLVLTIITCGIYQFYWMYMACNEVNRGLGRNQYNGGVELLLSFFTCGLWMLWWDWRIANSIYEMEQRWGVQPKMEPALMFLTAFFGLGPLFFQLSMNNAWENGRPGLEHQHPQHQMPMDQGQHQHQHQHQPPHDGW